MHLQAARIQLREAPKRVAQIAVVTAVPDAVREQVLGRSLAAYDERTVVADVQRKDLVGDVQGID